MSVTDDIFFKQATLSLFRDLEGDTALTHIRSFLKEHMPVEALTLIKYDEGMKVLRILAHVRPASWPKIQESIQCPDHFQGEMKKLVKTLQPIVCVNDCSKMETNTKQPFPSLFPEDSSAIRMSLVYRNVRLGSLTIHAEGKNRFTDEHVRLISMLYEPFTMAMMNIKRHREITFLKNRLEEENTQLKNEIRSAKAERIVGEAFGLKKVMAQVRQISKLSTTVLLSGETGVGKEMIANAIHQQSSRNGKPFIRVNCGAIPESLIDSELFGHERGAFTGAINRKKGRFEMAHGGTIFLDEIGELTPAAQVRLLRVIQHRELERVGGTDTIPVDVRIIAATHRDLQRMVVEGTFREDLLFRLDVFPIHIPPLRERLQDIPELVSYFIEKKADAIKTHRHFELAPGTLEEMFQYHWPGNVRELENVVERELIRSSVVKGENHLYFGDKVPQRRIRVPMSSDDTILPLEEVVITHIKQALTAAQGRVEGKHGAAAMLGMNPSTLRSRMRKLGIQFGKSTIS